MGSDTLHVIRVSGGTAKSILIRRLFLYVESKAAGLSQAKIANKSFQYLPTNVKGTVDWWQ
jgi:hypothetical protein